MKPEEFWENVDKTGGPDSCWLWKRSIKNTSGYGQARFRGALVSTHRLAWFLTHGAWPGKDRCVCHTCDVRACCNPAHLYDGTVGENQRDRWVSYRARRGTERKESVTLDTHVASYQCTEMATATEPAPPTEPVRIPRDILVEVDKRVDKAVKKAGVGHLPGLRSAIIAAELRKSMGLPTPKG